MRRWGWALAALLGAAGCDDGSGAVEVDGAVVDGAAGEPVDAGPAPDAEPDAGPATPDAGPVAPDAAIPQPDPAVFDPEHLVEVAVEIDPADWDALRVQNRGELDFARPDCLDAPFPSPYDWFPARVTVDGQVYDDVAIRKKGFYGSVSGSRPSVKIRFDKYVDGQTHRGLTRLTLNNGRQDDSRLRTCLAYGVFAAHGLPAPRCNFARLTVNGVEMGVFAHVESLKAPFLAAHFGDPSGWLYEGTLSDFRPEWRGTIEQKNHEDAPRAASIDRVIAALDAPDDELLEALDGALDLDAFLTFWATEALVGHWDGYSGNTNNFWFYEHPADGRIRFIPWGPDGSFQPPYLFYEGRRGPHSVFAIGAIARRLYLHPEGRARYVARMGELVAAWDPDALNAEIDRMQALIEPSLMPAERGQQAQAVAELRRYVEAKGEAIRRELAAGGAGWDLPLRPTLCTAPVGVIEGTFETTWGAWPTDNVFEAGDGTFEGTVYDTTAAAVGVGAAAGFGDQGAAVLISSQFFEDGAITFVTVAADPALFAPGEILLDDRIYCVYSVLDQRSGQVFQLATCETGQVVFDAIGQAPGAPVRGRFRLGLWGRPE